MKLVVVTLAGFVLGTTGIFEGSPLDVAGSVWFGPGRAHTIGKRHKNYALSSAQLNRAVAHGGSMTGVHGLASKLYRHERIVVTAVGGSVTHGHTDVSPPGVASMDDRSVGHPNSWSRLVFDWISERWPHPLVNVYVNAAVPGTGAEYFQSCLKRHLPNSTDLLLLEFGVNDAVT